jgi:hypothetical protein
MHLAHTKKHTQAERTPEQRSEFTKERRPDATTEVEGGVQTPPPPWRKALPSIVDRQRHSTKEGGTLVPLMVGSDPSPSIRG